MECILVQPLVSQTMVFPQIIYAFMIITTQDMGNVVYGNSNTQKSTKSAQILFIFFYMKINKGT